MAHYKDLIGSELRLNTRSYRRQSAVRRGVITEIGNGLNQKSLFDAAQAVATDLGNYHPQALSLPLQNISIRRIGADRAEYAAEYGHTGSSFNDASQVSVSHQGQQVLLVPWPSEVASGRRWTPNEYPPLVPVRATVLEISLVKTFTSLTAVQNAIGSSGLVNKVNNATVSIGGIDYLPNSLLFDGFESAWDQNNVLDGVQIRFTYRHRRYIDGSGVTRGWEFPYYEKISSRPYWQAQFQAPLSASFATIT
jgi:hypothetical protein